jgi:hypothetical protein
MDQTPPSSSTSSTPLNNDDTPAPVREALAARPDCRLAVQSMSSVVFRDGRGTEDQTRSYYLQCPGDFRPRLVHKETRQRPVESGSGAVSDLDTLLREMLGGGRGSGGIAPIAPGGGSLRARLGGSAATASDMDGYADPWGLGPALPSASSAPATAPPTLAQRERGKGTFV